MKKQADQVEQTCVGYSLRQLNRIITGIFNAEFGMVGLTSSQFNILTVIAKTQPASPTRIAKILHLEKSSLSRNVELMRRNGWLQAEGHSRALQLTITPQGEELYAQAFPHWQKAQKRGQALLGTEAARHLREVIKTMPSG